MYKRQVDCRSLFTYDELWYQLLVSASGLHAQCRLPVENVVDEEMDVELKSGLRCRGIIRLVSPSETETETGNTSTGFKLLLRDCPVGHDSEQIYRCLDSSRKYDDGDIEDVDGAVLVSADSAGGDLLCWWFGRSDSARFFLLSAPACYDGRMAATVQPLAVFTRSVSTSKSDVTSTSVSTPSHELSEQEVENEVVNESNSVAMYRHLLVTLLCALHLSTV